MSQLSEDLDRYSNELFKNGDLKAGLMLLGELSGMVTIGGLIFTALTCWLPGLNLTIPTGAVIMGLREGAKQYVNMDADQRRQIRAVATWARRVLGLIW
jgi:hypothetical protein